MKNAVRDLRGQLNWTQADLAEKLSVSRQTVNAIETEKYDPSLPLAFNVPEGGFAAASGHSTLLRSGAGAGIGEASGISLALGDSAAAGDAALATFSGW